ncbi:hypothetical protein [Bradyrhizobium sp. WYCCWR 12699]|nr:hypothetical protein [Bradyrhizobium sp. WYCCWR 12699]MDT4740665.1 hypothetical protein [Bradyrhizobium sp. WYCCWR 12699]
MKTRVVSGLHADGSPINSVAGGVDVAQGERRFHLNDLTRDVCA